MAHDGIAPITLQAMWPTDSLSAVECIGRVPWRTRMEEDFSPSHASAGVVLAADRRRRYLELLVRDDYERFHPEDTFDDLKRRARFSKEDKGVLRDWLALAERRERMLIAGTTGVAAE